MFILQWCILLRFCPSTTFTFFQWSDDTSLTGMERVILWLLKKNWYQIPVHGPLFLQFWANKVRFSFRSGVSTHSNLWIYYLSISGATCQKSSSPSYFSYVTPQYHWFQMTTVRLAVWRPSSIQIRKTRRMSRMRLHNLLHSNPRLQGKGPLKLLASKKATKIWNNNRTCLFITFCGLFRLY